MNNLTKIVCSSAHVSSPGYVVQKVYDTMIVVNHTAHNLKVL